MSGQGEVPTLAEQTAAFKSFATTDGEISAGTETAEETAGREQAAIADATAREAAQKPQRAETNAETADTSENPEATTESDASGEVSQPDSAATQEQKKPPKKTAAQRQAEIQARIDASTRELREIERRIEAAKTQTVATPQQGLTEKTQGATETDKDAPKASDFEFGELDAKFIKATAEYAAEKRFKTLQAESEQKVQQAALAREQAENRQKLQELMLKGAEKYEDFEEVVIEGAKANVYPISEVVGRLILGSDVGRDIAYHLASHPDEARQLVGKSPLEQAAYFGRLEARFSAPASGARETKVPQTARQATQPIRSAKGGGGSTQVTGATTDFAAFERLAMEGK
jgi:hypothetical protein